MRVAAAAVVVTTLRAAAFAAALVAGVCAAAHASPSAAPHAAAAKPARPAAAPANAGPDPLSAYPYGATDRPSWKAYLDRYNAAHAKYAEQYYDAEARAVNAKVAPYERQATADWIVLGLVIVIVLGGLALSAYQIFKGPRYADKLASAVNPSDTPRVDGEAAADRVTELKLSLQNIEVRSASIGFLILALSLAFFFLYLTFVYRVHATGA